MANNNKSNDVKDFLFVVKPTVHLIKNFISYKNNYTSLEKYKSEKQHYIGELAIDSATALALSGALFADLTNPITLMAIGATYTIKGAYQYYVKSGHHQSLKILQQELYKDFGINIKANDFNGDDLLSNYHTAYLMNHLLTTFHKFGSSKKSSQLFSKFIGYSFKDKANYLSAHIGQKFFNFLNKRKFIVKHETLSKWAQDRLNFSNDIKQNLHYLYQKSVYNFVDVVSNLHYIEKDLEDYLNEDIKKTDHYRFSPKSEKQKSLYRLNEKALVDTYQTLLIQNNQLSFIRILKDFSKAYLDDPQSSQTKKELDKILKYEGVFHYTQSVYDIIPEYKQIAKIAYGLSTQPKKWLVKNKKLLEQFNNDSYEKLVQRFNSNLSDGRSLYLLDFKDTFFFHRQKTINSNKSDFREDYREAVLKRSKLIYSFQLDDMVLMMDEKSIYRRNYKKLKIN